MLTQNEKSWGFIYKQQANKLKIEKVRSTLRRGEHLTKTAEETAQCLLDTHIPNDLSYEDTQEQDEIRSFARIASNMADTPFFTGKETEIAVKTFMNDKAPGMDLIEVKVLKIAVREIPEQFLRDLMGTFSGASLLRSRRRTHYEFF